MKPTDVIDALQVCITAKQPVFLWGAPGVGKSAVTHQVAAALQMDLRDVRAVLLDPVDLRGIPHVNGDGRAHWAIPEFLPRDGQGILFLDELNAAPPLVQAACYQLVLDRAIGDYGLPDAWVIVGAGNRAKDRAVVHEMPTALRNRFVHVEVEADSNDWSAWAVSAGVNPAIIAFLRWKPELLHVFNPNERAFPSPRSWEFAARLLATKPPKRIELSLLEGTVGTGAATELVAFLDVWRSMPSIDAILMNPTGAPIPDQPSVLYSVCSALAYRADVNNLGAVLGYAQRLPVEYRVLVARDCTRRDAALASTPDFVQFAVRNQKHL